MARLFATMVGFYAWTAQFMVVYGVTALACARGFADASLLGLSVVPLIIAAATALALAVTGVSLGAAFARRRRTAAEAPAADRFLIHLALVIGGLSLVAIAWTGLPALLVPACA